MILFLPIDIIKFIASYLLGDHLLFLKLTCKKIRDITKDLSCGILITPENFERVCDITGYHVMKISGSDTEFHQVINSHQLIYTCPLVKKLIVDYCGIRTNKIQYLDDFLETFNNLTSLKVIKCKDPVYGRVHHYMSKLSNLEIYTTQHISLTLEFPVEKVYLCSFQILDDRKLYNIGVTLPNLSFVDYEKTIKYNCQRKYAFISTTKDYVLQELCSDFVPNVKFLT